MVKTFKTDKDGYIKFTESELKALLDEIYNEGRSDGKLFSWSPPYYYNYCSTASNGTSDVHVKMLNNIINDSTATTVTADSSLTDKFVYTTTSNSIE